MNRPINSNETESIVYKNKSSRPDGFTGEFWQIFRDELTFILLKLFQKYWRERKTSKLILFAHHHPDTQTKDITK